MERLAMRGEERRGKERGGEERREEATHEEVRDNTGQSVPDRLSVVSLESSLHSSMAAELTRCRIALHFAQAEHMRMAATVSTGTPLVLPIPISPCLPCSTSLARTAWGS